MKKSSIALFLTLILLAVLACTFTEGLPATSSATRSTVTVIATSSSIPTLPPTNTHTPEPTPTPYQAAFGIDYAHPEKYLEGGEQTKLSDPTKLKGLKRITGQSIKELEQIYAWLKSSFTPYQAGGDTIGKVTVDELLEERKLGGCHDHGLVYAGVARELGYPAVMVHTVSIAWVELYQSGNPNPHIGHMFVEVYLNGTWVLIDATNGWYVESGYDPTNPVIPLQGSIAGSSEEIYGFYVERKSLDSWDSGIHSMKDTTRAMDELAEALDLAEIVYPTYTFKHFQR